MRISTLISFHLHARVFFPHPHLLLTRPSFLLLPHFRSAGCVIRVVAAEIHGSGLVETVNDMFEIDSVNRVGWTDRCDVGPTGEGRCEIASETKVTVYLLVPSWFPFTVKATERTGNFVVGQVVKQVVPRFLAQLKSDYATWAAGDDSREAKGADLFDVDIGSPADVEA